MRPLPSGGRDRSLFGMLQPVDFPGYGEADGEHFRPVIAKVEFKLELFPKLLDARCSRFVLAFVCKAQH